MEMTARIIGKRSGHIAWLLAIFMEGWELSTCPPWWATSGERGPPDIKNDPSPYGLVYVLKSKETTHQALPIAIGSKSTTSKYYTYMYIKVNVVIFISIELALAFVRVLGYFPLNKFPKYNLRSEKEPWCHSQYESGTKTTREFAILTLRSPILCVWVGDAFSFLWSPSNTRAIGRFMDVIRVV